MKVCFLSQDLNLGGGVERVASIIMNALSNEDWCEIYSLTYAKSDVINGKRQFEVSETIKKTYLLESHVSMKQAIIHEHIISKARKYLKDNRIDILVACSEMFFPVAVLAKTRHCKVICWDHTNPLVNSDQQFQKACRMFGFRRSDANVIITRSALDIVNGIKPGYKNKNYQIYNPIDPLLIKPHEYNPDSKKIISVGRLDYSKNFDRLLDIAAILFQHKEAKDWIWDIYGNGVEYDNLIAKRDQLQLQGKVNFKGQVTNLYDIYSEYSFYVMTSRYEGQPMTLLEAMANGLPLISFDILTGPNEIIKNGENGILCKKESNDEMINSILYLINNDGERIRMSNNSDKYNDLFSIKKIIQEWKKLLLSITYNNEKK